MALQVVDVRHDGTQGTVTLESDLTDWPRAIMELQSGAARNKAIEAAAAKGLADPRSASMNDQPYPVNAAGEATVANDTGGQSPLPSNQIHRYRVDVPLTRRLV